LTVQRSTADPAGAAAGTYDTYLRLPDASPRLARAEARAFFFSMVLFLFR
jgi:hypothetical protein